MTGQIRLHPGDPFPALTCPAGRPGQRRRPGITRIRRPSPPTGCGRWYPL